MTIVLRNKYKKLNTKRKRLRTDIAISVLICTSNVAYARSIEKNISYVPRISPEILIESTALPGAIHKDPMDRILVASARLLDMILVTRDEPILAYGREGHVRTLAC